MSSYLSQTNLSTSGHSYHLAQSTGSPGISQLLHTDPSNNLGLGLGRLFKAYVLDPAWNLWHKAWDNPSPEEMLKKKKLDIYRTGLKESVSHLERDLVKLSMNPKDGAVLARIEKLTQLYSKYLVPAEEATYRDLQQKIFKPLEEKIAKLALHRFQSELRRWMPALFQDKIEKSTDDQVQHAQIVKDSSKGKRALQQAVRFAPTMNLSALDGTNGFRMVGPSGSGLGFSVSTAGDLDGDGISEIILGASYASPAGVSSAGTAYVLYGKNTTFPSFLSLATTNTSGMTVAQVDSLSASDHLGSAVSTLGDITGDGLADFAVANWPPSLGTVYVFFGQRNRLPPVFNLSLDGTNGFIIGGLPTLSYQGISVGSAGDFNGDGISDFILGVGASSPGGINTGTVYVIFGQVGAWPSFFNVTLLNGLTGFAANGVLGGDQLGYAVAYAGDINGDRKADLVFGTIVGAPGGRSQAGIAYILFGQTGLPSLFSLSSLNGTSGFRTEGLVAGDELSYSVSTAGDLNGDGIDDFILGAPYASPGARSQAGIVYVVFGHRSGWTSLLSLSSLNGTNGFIIEGLVAGDRLGTSVSPAGDMNDDGLADVVIGASNAFSTAGGAYILFGNASVWPSTFDLTSLNGLNGFSVKGLIPSTQIGLSVSTAGDINGDNISDIILGGPYDAVGEVYVILGQKTILPITPTPSIPPTSFAPTAPPSITPTSFTPVTISVSIPANLNATFVSLSSGIISFSNNTNSIILIDNAGYMIVFTSNNSIVPLFTPFPAFVVNNFSIARGNGSLSRVPVFEACDVDGHCILSNATNPFGQIFTTEGFNWLIAGPIIGGVVLIVAAGGLIFYFTVHKPRQIKRIQGYHKKGVPLHSVQIDKAEPIKKDRKDDTFLERRFQSQKKQ